MSVRRSLSWSYGSQISNFLSGFIGSIFIARLLSPREVGVYAAAMAIVGILGAVLNLGLQTFLVKENELDQETMASAFTINTALSLISSSVIISIALLIKNNDIRPVLLVISLVPLAGIFQFLPVALLNREMDFKIISLNSALMSAVSSLTSVVCAFLGLSSMSAALGALAGSSMGALFLTRFARKHTLYQLSLKKSRAIGLFGLQMLTAGGAQSLSINICSLILSRVQGAAALGMFSRASGISTLIFSNVYGLATRVIFAKLSKDLRETGSMRETFVVSLEMITGIMWPTLIGLAVLSGPFIRLLYGPKWIDAALPLSILMVAQFVILAFGMNWELFVLREQVALQTKFEVVRAVVGLVFFAIGSFFGIAVASSARVAEALFGFALYQPRMRDLAGTRKHEFEKLYFRSLVLTAVAVMPSVVLMTMYQWSASAPLLPLFLSVILGICLWTITLFSLDHPLASEIKRLASRI